MSKISDFTLGAILKRHVSKVLITWSMVACENVLLVLLPLFIGFTIDSLLADELYDLFVLAGLLATLLGVAVARRVYDTRAYGAIRVEVGTAVDRQISHQSISTRDARLSMSRELVDFLENDIPPLMTAVIQLVAAVLILATFNNTLGLSTTVAGIVIIAIYAAFHPRFLKLNRSLNNQLERQVTALSFAPVTGVRHHLERLKRREVLISDTESIVYGLIFLVLFGLVVVNLWLTTQVESPTAGEIFSIVTYSLEFVEAAILLPMALQTLSRLTEISQRLNRQTTPSSKAQLEQSKP